MKVSKAQVGDNRRAILAAAGRLLRERGVEAVTVSDVMKAAGLTHGAFYGYFRSKDELVESALAELMTAPRPPGRWSASAAAYLSPGHRDDCGGGCPVAGLAGDAVRGSPEARAAMSEGVERMVQRIAAETPEAGREAAMGRAAAMVGALILSRAVSDAALSEELLAAARSIVGQGES